MSEAKLKKVHFVSLVKRMSCHNLIGSFSCAWIYIQTYLPSSEKNSKPIRLKFLHIRLTCQTTFIFGSRQKKTKKFCESKSKKK